VIEFDEFTDEYNDRINELNDAKLIIRELKVELREKDLENYFLRNSNIFLSIIEDDVIVSTSKKFSDSFVFIDDKDSIIDD
jgi:hypothetical protein